MRGGSALSAAPQTTILLVTQRKCHRKTSFPHPGLRGAWSKAGGLVLAATKNSQDNAPKLQEQRQESAHNDHHHHHHDKYVARTREVLVRQNMQLLLQTLAWSQECIVTHALRELTLNPIELHGVDS